MSLPVRDQLHYWGIAAAVLLGVLWLLGDVLLPFLVGAAVAYFLDPVVRRMQQAGLPRLAAVIVISLALASVVVLAGLLIIPRIFTQILQLFEAAPDIFQQLQAFVATHVSASFDADGAMRDGLAALGENIRQRGDALVEGVVTSARSVLGFFIFLVIAPVVAFYLLLDWPRLIARIDAYLPRDHAPTIRRLAGEIDHAIAGFVRGQLTVCLVLAVYYSGALMLAGLQYGLAVGVTAGLISFIPYIGAIVGGVLAIGLALFQFWGEPLAIGIVVAVFVLGQALEGNILVPKLVGRSVGLHPVWLLLALSAFGTLFGFSGMLVAIPLAAALGVLGRFAAEQYRASRLYDDRPGPPPGPGESGEG
ncbi:AI-2E family transporter [Alkalilacustris brevis]|uniref:AI-2E family transporter n=1 Tax=Alkalilacustris brevis TaxID=2026338 RepID=UPI000E0CD43C|nr:AI-2E family transporter [Alkalilacustris brevis]